MKTLREVIKELQEFGEGNNAMDLPCVYSGITDYEKWFVREVNPTIDNYFSEDTPCLPEDYYITVGGYEGPIVVL